MRTTTRLHNNQMVAHGHNQRDPEIVKKENEKRPHILVGGDHEVLIKGDLRGAYIGLFSGPLEAYNASQKRADRRMDVDDYMRSVEEDTRGNPATKKVKRTDGTIKPVEDKRVKRGKKLSYEFIVSAGNVVQKKRDANKRVITDQSGKEIRPEELPPAMVKEICKRYLAGFGQRNSHMHIVRCDWHADEGYYRNGVWQFGTPHMHLEYIPFGDGYKRGLSRQVSMSKALEQQGYGGAGGLQAWQAAERDILDQITRDVYKEYCKDNPDYYAQHGDLEIYKPIRDGKRDAADGDGVSPEAFVAEMEALDEIIAQVVELEAQAEEKKKELEDMQKAMRDARADQAAREHDLAAREATIKRAEAAQDAERNAWRDDADAALKSLMAAQKAYEQATATPDAARDAYMASVPYSDGSTVLDHYKAAQARQAAKLDARRTDARQRTHKAYTSNAGAAARVLAAATDMDAGSGHSGWGQEF